jgi:FAD/FMN-containing dehydrogenase
VNRRRLLKLAGAVPLVPIAWRQPDTMALAKGMPMSSAARRVRPSDPRWPSASQWESLDRRVGGQLSKVMSPFTACDPSPDAAACAKLFENLKNPYYIGDQAGLTQSLGWADAWTSVPSVYAVTAKKTEHVVAAVNFGREHDLRLVIKGGGHSYQGTSCAPDSLLIWMREMDRVVLHDEFVASGCAGQQPSQPAVTIGAGAIWMHVYNAVTTKAGRYVQGGGCATVGVAGLIQSGGFGSFSKKYGMAAASLLEAEIVTADRAVRIANACTNPDLFWAIKGGGGGSLGVVTKLTLRTHQLPEFFGGVFVTIKAASEVSFRLLIDRFIRFYREALFNPHWGETASFRPDNSLRIAMVFQGLDRQQAAAVWKPFFDWVAASDGDFSVQSPPAIAAIPARNFWDPEYLRQNLSGFVVIDDRPGASQENVFWSGDAGQAGQYLHGYRSAWLSANLLTENMHQQSVDALFSGTRHWSVSLHFNKGLAGAPAEAVAAAKDMATNPTVLNAFALAISAGEGPPSYPTIPQRGPNLLIARTQASAIGRAMNELLKIDRDAGSYVSEGNFFDANWQRSFWGENYPRLQAAKRRYDPDGLFFVHHGVGSEDWSANGFTRLI